jgi:SSS family transporter
MSPLLILVCVGVYFAMLLTISYFSSRNADNDSYFNGNKQSPWYLVAFGLIADSLSGVTYISVPGAVGTGKFSYMQLVLGYFFGYMVISYILLPLYYNLQLTSIYSYLRSRFGRTSQRTGSFFFLISRLFGAAARLYLAAIVMQTFLFDQLGIPFWLSVTLLIFLMLSYTYKGGIKTLVYTDSFQAIFLLLGVILTIAFIMQALEMDFGEMIGAIRNSPYSQTFFWDIKEGNYFWKQFLGGMFIAIAMTGLDQNMMQKSLSCPTLKDAQRNINYFSVVIILVNLLFVGLGALLYLYASEMAIGLPSRTDELYPVLAFQHLGTMAGLVFIIGLSAATFSSADSVLTTLTTAFYIDFIKKDDEPKNELSTTRTRYIIHFLFSVLLLITILGIKALNNQAVIDLVFLIAGYTYGPLLGLFFMGILTKINIRDKWVPLVAGLAPLIGHSLKTILYLPALVAMESSGTLNPYNRCMLYISRSASELTGLPLEYKIGTELILIIGIITAIGLWVISTKKNCNEY